MSAATYYTYYFLIQQSNETNENAIRAIRAVECYRIRASDSTNYLLTLCNEIKYSITHLLTYLLTYLLYHLPEVESQDDGLKTAH